ncbi:MAG TPA: ABC transporter permease [candidate division Zixibacteria bacterium]|nr:ABC transporter permease [candidate division Zixibacteria bacterium]
MTAVTRRIPAPPPEPAVLGTLRRARRVVQRNAMVYRHSWLVIVSGFFEPLFFLLGIGFGLGSFVQTVELRPGFEIPYAAFVAPGLLAMSCLNGAIAETIFNVFFRLNYERIYEGMMATPLGIRDIAIGELIWSLFRGTLYAAAFVAVMFFMGLVFSPWVVLVVPGAILLGAAFSAAGLATTAYLRTVQDFDLPMGLVVMPMFLFGGVFFPISVYPEPAQAIVQVLPLYRGVHLFRGLSTGTLDVVMLLDVLYLLAMTAVGLTIAMRQMERRLIK